MELIVSRIGTHAFLQFETDNTAPGYNIEVLDDQKKVVQKYKMVKKNFLLINRLKSDEKYTLHIKNRNGDIVIRKKI